MEEMNGRELKVLLQMLVRIISDEAKTVEDAIRIIREYIEQL